MGGGVVIAISSLPRGFGFVTFMDQAGVDKVLAQTRHELDSKTVSFTLRQVLPSPVLCQDCFIGLFNVSNASC